MQTTLSATPGLEALRPDVSRPALVAEFHVLRPPHGDSRAAHALAQTLRALVAAAPQARAVDCTVEPALDHTDPDGEGGLFPLGLNVWSSLEALRDYVHRAGPILRRWRLGPGRSTPVPQRVLWWTTQIPDLAEARLRLRSLRRHGPGPGAFTLRSPHPAPRDPQR
jgi:hypothetical protein